MVRDLNKALREGVFGLPWFFATAPQRKLNEVKPYIIEGYDIVHVCSEVDNLIPRGKKGEMSKTKLSLYLASQLVYGLALILERKFMLLEVDAQLVYESFIRISCFDELRAPLTSTRPKKGKRKSKTQLDDLHIDFDESFFKAVDLPLPNTEYATTDMDLITLKEVSHKRSLLLDSFDHRNALDIFDEQTCFQTQTNTEKDKLTNLNFSAKQLMNDEISFFLPSINSSFTRKNPINLTAKTSTQNSKDEMMNGEIIEISTTEKHVYLNNSGENDDLLKISQELVNLSPQHTQTSLAVIKPLPDTPKRRSYESLEFELEALKHPFKSVAPARKRKLLRDEIMQLTFDQLRANMDDFSDTMSRPSLYKEKKYPTAEELFNVEPYWYPKNCVQRTLFKSCTAPHCDEPGQQNPSSQKTVQDESEEERTEPQSFLSNWLNARNGYSYIRETPERNCFEILNATTQKDNSLSQPVLAGNIPNPDFNETVKSNLKESQEFSPSQQFNYFGSKANRSAKERITLVIIESVQPIFLSQIFPVKLTSRKTAAAAFQSVLELLKDGTLVVEQLTPYGDICLKRSGL
ncbi:unnamed protein product [Auanema sp. JU1783]|nr:unnamed protein product [Auanema sp. JU1783]